MPKYEIINNDVLSALKDITSNSIHMAITSPPYYNMRQYSDSSKEIGCEETVFEYVDVLKNVFREVRRVLRDDGTFWLNIGDSYLTTPTGSLSKNSLTTPKSMRATLKGKDFTAGTGYKMKNLLGVPWRLAFALQEDGWILRSDIIWEKISSVPHPVKDRPVTNHEYIFLFSKKQRYFYDVDAVREPCKKENEFHPLGKNQRTVWRLPTASSGEHIAAFHPLLVEKPILAGTSSYGCCADCGEPYYRDFDKKTMESTWSKKCHCQTSEIRPALVLDPFNGSATTGVTALKLGRDYIGIEINEKYAELSKNRIKKELGI